MNVEMGTEAVQFPEKEYINGIFVSVCCIEVAKNLVGQRWAHSAKTKQCLQGLGHEMDSAFVDKHGKI